MVKQGEPKDKGKITFRPSPGDSIILKTLIKRIPEVKNVSDAIRHCIRVTSEHYDIKPFGKESKEATFEGKGD